MTNFQINIIKKRIFEIMIFLFLFISCKNDSKSKEPLNTLKGNSADAVIISNKHEKNIIWCDLDDDKKEDKVEIVINQKNDKSGLRITFGNQNRIDYLGLGKNVLQQEFDDFDWVGIFEKAPKGKTYWNNVNEDGEIKIEKEEFTESDKLVLQNDGIFVHAAESCGGGIIYLKNGAYKWLQQE